MKKDVVYRTRRIVIDSGTLKVLKTMESRRRIINAHVNRLYKVLSGDGHFDTPLVVNKVNENHFRLIDGNHRFEAIKKWIKEEPKERKIQVEFAIYSNLDKEGERQVYTRWNSGRKQSSNDFVKMYATEIPILQSMLKKFPAIVRIYGLQREQRGLHFSSLMKAYFMTREPFPKFKPYMGAAKKFVDDCQTLTNEDYDKLTDFVKFFEKTLGYMEKDNPYQTTTMMNCIATVYFDNIDEVGEDILIKLFRRRVLAKASILILGGSGGRVATENLYNQMRAEFSKGRARNPLKFRNLGDISETGDIPATTEVPVV